MNDPDDCKQVIRAIQTQLPPIVPTVFSRKREIGVNFLDANLIWVAPECHDIGGLADLSWYFCLKCTLSKVINECIKEKKDVEG
jgi:hypothetical protein